MGEAGTLLARRLEADAEPARLVVRAVRRARDLPVLAMLAPARHPGLEVELAVRRPAQVAGAGVNHLVRQAEALEDLLLDAEQLLMDRVALLRGAEYEHFDFREL